MEYVVGIDLGTTNSCVAIVEKGEPMVIANKGGYRTTPSIVASTEGGRRMVGHLAKRQLITNPTHTVYGAKRLIGRRWDSSSTEIARTVVPYKILEGPNGDVRLSLHDDVYSTSEIAACILQEMRLIAEAYVGAPIDRAVVTVPAYFNDNQRQATKDAGRIAGLEIIRIINEPTAAALAFGYGKQIERKVAVYDFGGGTFDISILDIGVGLFQVIATGGDTFLGGEDFDQRVVEYLVESLEDERDIDLRADPLAMQRLRDAAEQARCDLSEHDQVTIDLPFLHTTPSGEVHHLRGEILTRSQLESLTEDLIEKTIKICEKAMTEADIDRAVIDDVVLVGGMTKMPMIRQKVSQFFDREPCQGINPDEVVALGAAIQAASLCQEVDEMLLLDVASHDLGVMIAGGNVHCLVEKNTTVPTKAGHVFTTTHGEQKTLKIVVIQGEKPQAIDNELLGEFILSGLGELPRGVQIDVSFMISVDGIVSVRAKDLNSGEEQSIIVNTSSGLSEEEIQRLVDESDAFMFEARASVELAGRRRQVDQLMRDIQGCVPRVRVVMNGTRFGREALTKVDGVLHRSERELHVGDLDSLNDTMESLERTYEFLRGIAERSGE